MRYLLSLALALAPAGIARATEFRCYPPDPAGYFQAVMASPDSYRIVLGHLSFDPALPPSASAPTVFPPGSPFPARFEGLSFGLDGPGAPTIFDLTVVPSCNVLTCPYLHPGVDALIFVRLSEDGPVIDADPCLTPFFDTAPATLALLSACLRGEAC
jgi:hypothetical protein